MLTWSGGATQAGCARFIVALCMNRRLAFEPHADSFLKALSGAIRSKNPIIRKSFATATGYVCQLASIEKLESLSKHLTKLYVEESGEFPCCQISLLHTTYSFGFRWRCTCCQRSYDGGNDPVCNRSHEFHSICYCSLDLLWRTWPRRQYQQVVEGCLGESHFRYTWHIYYMDYTPSIKSMYYVIL